MLEEERKIDKEEYQYLLHILAPSDPVKSLIHHSEILLIIPDPMERIVSNNPIYQIKLIVPPELFKRERSKISEYKKKIKKLYQEITDKRIAEVKILPNLKGFHILKNDYAPILTPWDEINNDQGNLLTQLQASENKIDYQNVGNSARTLLQKLAAIVYVPDKHLPSSDSGEIDLSEGSYKNRLHTYIRCELGGQSYQEIRRYILSEIETAEKAIDIANKLTHSLNAHSFLAEACIISTLKVVEFIKLVDNTELTD